MNVAGPKGLRNSAAKVTEYQNQMRKEGKNMIVEKGNLKSS